MSDYLSIAIKAYQGFFNYLIKEITFSTSPFYINYFWALTFFSVGVYVLEILFPWRKNQPIIRDDFFLDLFYMYFNFFIFKLIFFSSLAAVTSAFLSDLSGGSLASLALIHTDRLPYIVQLLLFFLVLDFVQWLTHRALHRVPLLWEFHKVHHSIRIMGFAGHLRYHWMETVIYTPVKFIAMVFIVGFEPDHVFMLYYAAILIGHINHSNINITYGPLKYILNNPVMHIWHHAETIPGKYRYGVNFGISLSLWDYIFKTAYTNKDGRDIPLGFNHLETFPKSFFGQLIYPLNKK